MNNYREIKGDLVKLSLQGEFDVIAHGCNCFCKQASGLAPQMVRAFGTDKFEMEAKVHEGDYNKLGTIDHRWYFQEKEEYGGKWVLYPDEKEFLTGKTLHVVNAYTQYRYGKNHKDGDSKPLDYDALRLCMRKINFRFSGKHIGLPGLIGCGLAGGDPVKVKTIIKQELKDCNITIVYL